MAQELDRRDDSAEVAVRDPELLSRFAEMVTLIPAEEGGGAERILAQILDAQRWDELDSPWETSKAERLLGRKLDLLYAERRPSDFREGLGMFLVLHMTDIVTGESIVVTTSALGIIGQVTRAYALDALPAVVEFIVAERATQRGYRPHHLKWHSGTIKADAQASA